MNFTKYVNKDIFNRLKKLNFAKHAQINNSCFLICVSQRGKWNWGTFILTSYYNANEWFLGKKKIGPPVSNLYGSLKPTASNCLNSRIITIFLNRESFIAASFINCL